MFVYLGMVDAALQQIGDHEVHTGCGDRELERTCIGKHTGVETHSHVLIQQRIIAMEVDEVIDHFAGAAFGRNAYPIVPNGLGEEVVIYEYLGLRRICEQLLQMFGAVEVVEIETEDDIRIFESCCCLVGIFFVIDEDIVSRHPPQKIGHFAWRNRRYRVAFGREVMI